LIVRHAAQIICKPLRRGQPALTRHGVRGLTGFKIETWETRIPPAHREKTAMNGAQLLMAKDDSLGLMSGPPAVV